MSNETQGLIGHAIITHLVAKLQSKDILCYDSQIVHELRSTPDSELVKIVSPKKHFIDILLKSVQMAYRKHAKGDEDIGWDELSKDLSDTLAEVMGDVEFVEWNTIEDLVTYSPENG